MIEHLGKGAVRQPADQKTLKFRHAFAAIPPVNFNVPFSSPEPISNDQNGSSSCVAQAWSYGHEMLEPGKRFSRRDIYSQISLGPNQGAYIYDGHDFILNKGQALREDVPDPTPETETGMLDKTGITPDKESANKELEGLTVSLDINQWAAAIKLLGFVVGGLEGTNAGWTDLANPSPPPPNGAEWGHCLCFFGYHMHDGQKCVIAKSSWGTAGNTTVHHIKENYFNSGFMFNAYTLKRKDMSNTLLVKKGNEFGFYLPANSEQALIDKADNFGYPLPKTPDGKQVDWANVKPEITI